MKTRTATTMLPGNKRVKAARSLKPRAPPATGKLRRVKLGAKGRVDEDAVAARVIARSEAAIAAGVEMIVPADVAEAIARGEPALRAVRKWRDMTQMALSEATGIDQGTISDMERDGSGRVKNWRKAATALAVPLDLIVP